MPQNVPKELWAQATSVPKFVDWGAWKWGFNEGDMEKWGSDGEMRGWPPVPQQFEQ